MNAPALIALGGNVGDVRATFETALQDLDDTPGVTLTAASRPYRTPAVGADAGGEFLNAAATLETTLSPHGLLDVLKQVEANAGRERTVHWGPRSLDLDLILYGEERIEDDRLTVPHPGLAWRRFVLDPACEVAGDWRTRRVPLRSLRERLLDRPLRVGAGRDPAASFSRLVEVLAAEFPVAFDPPDPPGERSQRLPAALSLVPEGEKPGVNQVVLPSGGEVALARLRDVFAAALPDPEPQPFGDPLWSSDE
ncbi:2-amino-4-hydroxy-6-hydroxymethyldihydropteridine diphosphokinase [Alienimonas chondri]|uniref:2-amino-4-hydroxy-6-hydroxymethyldihydropteridine pyrophosphokinase n=1 Tax=Alienimonas chondri TaxID=2681879 RepID=A0ABX1VJC6_9PLAN|nr:2-amino-4-hydroxy-6-hydroxymethyldihydropteridine diphosphokinase [Alienimonas chondri]NNJ26911.1 hypothetical protein [Alienimonas chondri]